MIRAMRLTLLLLPLALATCAPTPVPAPAPVVGVPAPPAPTIAPADAAFALGVAQGSLFAARLSEVALRRATRAGIRAFAQTVVDTETQATARLADIMRAKGLEPPQAPSAAQTLRVEAVDNTPEGSRFAKAYFSALVRSQVGLLRQMEAYALSGVDPELKAFAAEQAPILRDQLARARRVPRQRGAQST